MLVKPATVRSAIRESTAMFSPSSPSAVIAFARNVTPAKVGLAETDMKIGVDEQLLIATLVMVGFEMPRIASPCPASLISEFETAIELLVISTTPCEVLLLPNLSRQREIAPDEPGRYTMRFQSPRAGALIEPLLLVSPGRPKLSSWIEVTVMVSPTAAVPFMLSVPLTVIE